MPGRISSAGRCVVRWHGANLLSGIKKSDLKYQVGCVSIMTEGVPTNGYLPLRVRKLLRHCWGALGRSNFFFCFSAKKLRSLATILKIVDKTDDRNDERAKCKQLDICNHTNPPFLLFLHRGKIAKRGFRPPLSYPFRARRPWLF